MALLSHLAVLSALVLIGARLYGDRDMGVAMGTLYMLLPCTAFDVQKVAHVLPAAFVLWAILCFRSPVKAGMFLGLASGTLFFPIFLLPLWALFYGGRGAVRFLASVAGTAGVLLAGLVPLSGGAPELLRRMLGYVEWRELQLRVVDSGPGFWSNFEPAYRIPVIVSFLLMLAVVSVWPRKKHLGHLIAYSAAITLGTQFWYTQQGGVYVLWYLPLVLLIVFRPGVHALEALEARPLATPTAAVPPRGCKRSHTAGDLADRSTRCSVDGIVRDSGIFPGDRVDPGRKGRNWLGRALIIFNLQLIRKPSDACASLVYRRVAEQAQPGFRRGCYPKTL